MIHKSIYPSLHIIRLLLYSWLCVLVVGCTVPTPAPTPTPSPAVRANDEIAVLTRVDGQVTRQDTNGNQESVQAFTTLAAGDRLQLAENTHIAVVCFADYYFTVDVAGDVEITEERCAAGTGMPTGSALRVKPDAGRIVLIEGSLALEEQARERESDYGNIPIILSPRNTSLIDFAPEISWVAVEGALEYQLGLSGLASFSDVILNANEVACADELDVTGSRVCSAAWPESWTLEPGQRYFLTVSARTGIASPLRGSEVSALRTLDQEQAKTVQDEISKIQALALDEGSEAMLLAPIYVTNGLNANAITAYTQATDFQPNPLLYVALGDSYREIDLQRYAVGAYQDALALLEQNDDVAVRAAAEFGLGHVYFARQNFVESVIHARTADELYKLLPDSPTNSRLSDAAGSLVIEGESR